MFAAILDHAKGAWSLAPAAPFSSTRTYLRDTNVLQTHFHSSSGSVTLTDLMPVASEHEKRTLLVPDHEILRVVV